MGRQQFEAHLAELRSKAELLSSRLDQESAARCTAEGEVGPHCHWCARILDRLRSPL